MPREKVNGLHVIRNPYGWEPEDVRKATLELCDVIDNPIFYEALRWYVQKRMDFAAYTSRKNSVKRDNKPFTEEDVRKAWDEYTECKVYLDKVADRFLKKR